MAAMRRRRFDVIELGLVSVFLALVAFRVGVWLGAPPPQPWQHPDERTLLDTLRQRYGPDRYSGTYEEWIVRDYFNDARGGVFVDVGAYYWRHGSNTYVLERELDWTGLAIDAAPGFADGWRQHRPASRFVEVAVTDRDGDTLALQVVPGHPDVSSLHAPFARLFGADLRSIQVPTARLDTLLEQAGFRRIDFLSMDIEQSEPAALRGFSIERYRPRLVCIEAHAPTRQFILDYFARAGYVLLGKYLRVDPWNLWFAPLGAE